MASKSIESRRQERLAQKADNSGRRSDAELDTPTLVDAKAALAEVRTALERLRSVAGLLVVDITSDHVPLAPHLRHIDIPLGNVENIVKTLTADAEAALATEA